MLAHEVVEKVSRNGASLERRRQSCIYGIERRQPWTATSTSTQAAACFLSVCPNSSLPAPSNSHLTAYRIRKTIFRIRQPILQRQQRPDNLSSGSAVKNHSVHLVAGASSASAPSSAPAGSMSRSLACAATTHPTLLPSPVSLASWGDDIGWIFAKVLTVFDGQGLILREMFAIEGWRYAATPQGQARSADGQEQEDRQAGAASAQGFGSSQKELLYNLNTSVYLRRVAPVSNPELGKRRQWTLLSSSFFVALLFTIVQLRTHIFGQQLSK